MIFGASETIRFGLDVMETSRPSSSFTVLRAEEGEVSELLAGVDCLGEQIGRLLIESQLEIVIEVLLCLRGLYDRLQERHAMRTAFLDSEGS